MAQLLAKLEGGDRRSIGRVDEVVAIVLDDPERFDELFMGMLVDSDLVRMRAADAVEKITIEHPEWLWPYKELLLNVVSLIEQQEVRWHWAQMIPRLSLTRLERQRAFDILLGYVDDKSSIVKTFSLQAMVDLVRGDEDLSAKAIPVVKAAAESGSPAMKSRGRRLLMELEDGS